MRRPLLILVLLLVAVVSWRAWAMLSTPPPPALDTYGEVGDFALTDRSGETIHCADLLGKVWVAGFAFTRCTGPCPQVTGTMGCLQSEFQKQLDFRLVSFSVDPDHDTPEVLERYAKTF